MGCVGAHPTWNSDPNAVDVQTRSELVTTPPASRLPCARSPTRAEDAFVMDPGEKPQLLRGLARLDAEGGVVGEYPFTNSRRRVRHGAWRLPRSEG